MMMTSGKSLGPFTRSARTAVWFACFAIGCGPKLYTPRHVFRQDEAGSSHIAILSVAPWERYRDAVQPTFKLQADEAVKMVIPDTMALEEKLVSSFAAKGKVALPTTGTTATSTTTAATGTAASTSDTVTRTLNPGDASAITFADAPRFPEASTLGPANSVLGTTLGTDPMLRYWTATALYEEVQMLNRYVRDAATAGYYPYVVRMQVTLMPRSHRLPYDAYTSVSLFQGDFLVAKDPGNPGGVAPLGPLDFRGQPRGVGSAPRVVPMLVTDDLESVIHSRSVEKIRQLALAFAGMFNGVSFAGDIQKLDDQLRTVLGRDFNSTFTVARASDNTVRLRFGAMAQAASEYAMIPQAHNVTLLVLMPKAYIDAFGCKNPPNQNPGCEEEYPVLRAVAKTSMVDADTGKELRPGWRTSGEKLASCNAAIAAYPGATDADCSTLLQLVETNDYVGFVRSVQYFPEALWSDLTALRTKSQWTYARVNLPQRVTARLHPNQTATLLDDTKTATTVTLRGEGDLYASRLAATLNLATGKSHVLLASNGTRISDDGHAVMFTFPSLKAYNQTGKDGLRATNAVVDVSMLDDDGRQQKVWPFSAIYVAKAPEEASVSLSARAKVIDATHDGLGSVQLVADLSKATAPVTLSVDGADVDAASGLVDMSGGKLTLLGSGTFTLQLRNLHPVSNVSISAKDKTGSTKQLVFLVMQAAPQKQ